MARIYRKYKCGECDYRATSAGPLNLHRFQAHKRGGTASPRVASASTANDPITDEVRNSAMALSTAMSAYVETMVRWRLRRLADG